MGRFKLSVWGGSFGWWLSVGRFGCMLGFGLRWFGYGWGFGYRCENGWWYRERCWRNSGSGGYGGNGSRDCLSG